MWNFTHTFFKSFSIESSTRGKIFFDNTLDEYLIITRHNVIGIYSYKKALLELKKEIELFANIKHIKRIPSSSPNRSDYFFCLSDDLSFTFCTLDNGELVSLYHGEVSFPSSALLELDEIKVIADTDQYYYTQNYSFGGYKYVAVQAYKEILNIFPFRYSNEGEIKVDKPFPIRMIQENIIDIVALDPRAYKSPKNMIGILCNDSYQKGPNVFQAFQAIELNIQAQELNKKISWELVLPKDVNMFRVVELPEGAIIIFAENHVYYYPVGSKTHTAHTLISGKIQIVERIPGNPETLILGDTNIGSLYLIARTVKKDEGLKFFGKGGPELASRYLGTTSLPKNITYLADSTIFLGSVISDSLVLKVLDNLNVAEKATMPYLEIIETFYNLGAISDLKLRKKSKESANSDFSVLTTSYEKKKNQLNLLQSGITITIEGSIEIPHIDNLFIATLNPSDYTLAAITTPFNTITLRIPKNGSQVTGITIDGLDYEKKTLLIAAVGTKNLVQVTKERIILLEISEMSDEKFNFKGELAPSEGYILFTELFNDQLYIVTSRNRLIVYDLSKNSIQEKGKADISFKPCYFTINEDHIAIAGWNQEDVYFYDRAKLVEVGKLSLKMLGVKSLKFTTLGTSNNTYLFCGFIDGMLRAIKYSYIKDGNSHNIANCEEYSYFLGATPVTLKELKYSDKHAIFAGCDTPSLLFLNKEQNLVNTHIHSHEIKNIHVQNINGTEHFTFITQNHFNIGVSDANDKVQVKPLSLDSQEEILYSISVEEFNMLILGVNTATHGEVCLYDMNSYDIIKRYPFEGRDISIMTLFTQGDWIGLAVGVNLIDREEGELVTFEVIPNGLLKVQEISFDREVTYITTFLDNYMVVGLHSFIKLYKIAKEEGSESNFNKRDVYNLVEVLSKPSYALISYLHTYVNYLLVVDHFKGLYLYLYNEEENKLVLIGRSISDALHNQIGVIIDENNFLLNKEDCIQILRRNRHADNEGDRLLFLPKASINLREAIYSIEKGAKTLSLPIKSSKDLSNIPIDYIVFGTIRGSIGVVAILPENVFTLLNDLQTSILADLPKGFGNNYTKWRSYKDKMTNEPQEVKGFVDGEVLKRILNYPLNKLEKILNNMSTLEKPSPTELFALIETLTKKILI